MITSNELDRLQPESVFRFFRIISQIPRGSANTEKIAEYCLDFAQERNLRSARDTYGNVVIYSDGTDGYENCEPIILQAHLDMVCEKDPQSAVNMKTDSIKLCCDGKYMWADGTTLGGDDGIGVTYILALLDSNDIPHPPIEALFTADEEIGLLGACNLDPSLLSGRRLINIDSEKEGILTVSCAGGVRAFVTFPLVFSKETFEKCCVEITLEDFAGGHSGVDIDKNHKNALKVLAQILEEISMDAEYRICSLAGGSRENIIPKQASAVICFEKKYSESVLNAIQNFNIKIRTECALSEPDGYIKAVPCNFPDKMYDKDSTEKIVFSLLHVPDGIIAMSPDMPGMVQSSLNLGCASAENEILKFGLLIRSNTSEGKRLVVHKLTSFSQYLGGKTKLAADYPEWEYRADSPLRDIMKNVYKDIYNEEPQVSGIHAGLECGILSGKINDADMVSFGPDIENVHTTSERMNIESVQRCWEYLKAVLKKLK
ncbi:MAG: aminoacyl-histidine dipeptidase [Oscillospiraceae bacterium]|nr:aminoacyl-histidine dipeptidase [Oscillospiraceae bacterium]